MSAGSRDERAPVGDVPVESSGGRAPGPALPGDRGGQPPAQEVFHGDLCGAVMLNLHCKLTCERCGYKRDCSDP